MKQLFAIFIGAMLFASPVRAQSKLHFDVDYHYNLGFVENFMGTKLTRGDYGLSGHSIRFAPRYDFAERWSAGIGVGWDRYNDPDYNTLPIFATVRYYALQQVPNAYAFADLGYAIKTGDYVKGFTGSLGVGYTYQIAKHFGLNFQIAYNLKQFADVPLVIINENPYEVTTTEKNCTRHSLSLGVGITF